ncbi:unnamed protein product [Amoebophrya sp. A120]|nr:unnamed protein product [Amoebophrya sp. A120]|eukprot:GSA120T00008283001.1
MKKKEESSTASHVWQGNEVSGSLVQMKATPIELGEDFLGDSVVSLASLPHLAAGEASGIARTFGAKMTGKGTCFGRIPSHESPTDVKQNHCDWLMQQHMTPDHDNKKWSYKCPDLVSQCEKKCTDDMITCKVDMHLVDTTSSPPGQAKLAVNCCLAKPY